MKKNNVARTANVVNQISQADELKKYKELLDNNVITQEEFDKKKNKYWICKAYRRSKYKCRNIVW